MRSAAERWAASLLGWALLGFALSSLALAGLATRQGALEPWLAVVLAIGGVGAAWGLAFALYWRASRRVGEEEAAARVNRWGRRLSLSGLVFLVPALRSPSAWATRETGSAALVVLVCAALALAGRGRWGWPGGRRPPRWAVVGTLLACVLGYVGFVGWVHVEQHHALRTAAFDLGVMENVVWNTLHHHWFDSSLEGGNHLDVHASYILAAIVPFYALSPRAETLLILQSALLGAAALPLYLLARARLGDELVALGVAVAWLLHPAVGRADLYDFHELAFAPLLTFSAAWCLESRRALGLWCSVALLLTVKEDMGVGVALLGVYAALGGRPRVGVALLVAGAASFLALTGLVVERSFARYFTGMIAADGDATDLVVALLTRPFHAATVAASAPKLLYVLQIFGPVGFLCFARPRGAALVSYGLLLALFASKAAMFSLGFQYALYLVPGAFIGALDALGEVQGPRRGAALAFAGLLTLVGSWRDGIFPPLHPITAGYAEVRLRTTAEERRRYEAVRALARRIPRRATVTASDALVPQVAGRRWVYTLRYLDSPRAIGADWFLLQSGDAVPGWLRPRLSLVEREGDLSLYQQVSSGGAP